MSKRLVVSIVVLLAEDLRRFLLFWARKPLRPKRRGKRGEAGQMEHPSKGRSNPHTPEEVGAGFAP